jgi:ASC-1-like (ASCH) protein
LEFASVVPVRKQKTGLENLVKDFKKKVEGRFNTEKKRK